MPSIFFFRQAPILIHPINLSTLSSIHFKWSSMRMKSREILPHYPKQTIDDSSDRTIHALVVERFTICRLIYHRLRVKWKPSAARSSSSSSVDSCSTCTHMNQARFYFPPTIPPFHHVVTIIKDFPLLGNPIRLLPSSSSYLCTDGWQIESTSIPCSQIWLSDSDRRQSVVWMQHFSLDRIFLHC